MYAIFETGGKQYKVASGDVLRIEKLSDAEAGKKYKFDKVLAVSDDKSLLTGTPYLEAATVTAQIIGDGKAEKVIIYKFKAKKDYRKKQGHRQPYTEIEIETVEVAGKTLIKKIKKEEPKAAPEEESTAIGAEAAQTADKATSAKTKKTAKADTKSDVVDAADSEAEDSKVEDVKADDDKTADEPAKAASEKPKAQTKADIAARLDELGVEYAKSLKKDELLALLSEAESADASAKAKEDGIEIE